MTELLKFNNRVHNFHTKVQKEASLIAAQLSKRVKDSEDALEDYEMKMKISFYLKKEDEEFDEDADNILVTHTEFLYMFSLGNEKENWCCDNTNYNMLQYCKHEMSDEHHCWLYCCLYAGLTNSKEELKSLSFEDILRIGRMRMDLKVDYQYFDK